MHPECKMLMQHCIGTIYTHTGEANFKTGVGTRKEENCLLVLVNMPCWFLHASVKWASRMVKYGGLCISASSLAEMRPTDRDKCGGKRNNKAA